MKNLIPIAFILILTTAILLSLSSVKAVWSQEPNVISREKQEALEEGRKGKRQEMKPDKSTPLQTPVGPLTPETIEMYKSSLAHRVEFVRDNVYKNDTSISPTLEHLNSMLTPAEMFSIAPEIVEILLDVAERHAIPIVRTQALTQLRYLGHKSASPRLKTLLPHEKDMAVKVYIARTLIRLGEKEDVLHFLKDVVTRKDIETWKLDTTGLWSGYDHSQREREEEKCREVTIPNAAIEGLAEIGTEEAKSIIKEALSDRNPSVRKKANAVLEKLR